MNERINLKDIRRQVVLYYAEDGLADISVGLVILGFGLLLWLDFPTLVGLLVLVPLLVWFGGKNWLVIPRVGSIQPGRELKQRFRGFFLNLFLLGIGFLVFILVSRRFAGSDFAGYSLSLFGFVLALGISSLGVLMDASRFYLYGGLVFLAMAGGEVLGRTITAFDPFLMGVIGAGAVITLAGLVVLGRFLGKYPVIEVGE
jgi:hypothetical protein